MGLEWRVAAAGSLLPVAVGTHLLDAKTVNKLIYYNEIFTFTNLKPLMSLSLVSM